METSCILLMEKNSDTRVKMSIYCSLVGQTGCEWNCKMKGYLEGKCLQAGEELECECREVTKNKIIGSILTQCVAFFKESSDRVCNQ